jgi:malate/lactate dehydrogenase
MRELDRASPDAVVILVSNPVDVLTRIAIEASTRPAQLVMGSGTALDGPRLRQRLAELLGVEKEDVHVYGVGDVVFSLPCVIGRAGVERQLVPSLSEDEQRRLERSAEVLDTAYRSVIATGSSPD